MNQAVQLTGSPWLDDNHRLAWIAPLAIALWLGLLTIFGHLLGQTAPPRPQINAVEARLIELPPPAGLQSATPAAHAPVAPKPTVRHVVPHVIPHHVAHRPIVPPVPASAEGTAKKAPASAPMTSVPAGTSSTGAAADQDASSNLAGLGNDSSGARAIYAPTPEIPDELREEPLDTVAVAHFVVSTDGHAQVNLTQPTANPRLNDLLLATLKQWRFAPATRKGIAIPSEFDIRIPVTIQ
jgi:protein TonB